MAEAISEFVARNPSLSEGGWKSMKSTWGCSAARPPSGEPVLAQRTTKRRGSRFTSLLKAPTTSGFLPPAVSIIRAEPRSVCGVETASSGVIAEAVPEVNSRCTAAVNWADVYDPPEPTVKIPWSHLFPHRQAWAFATAKGLTDCFWWFYLVYAILGIIVNVIGGLVQTAYGLEHARMQTVFPQAEPRNVGLL